MNDQIDSQSSEQKQAADRARGQQATTAQASREQALTFMQMLKSVFAAAFGVQSKANRERDFSRGKASHFILIGVGFTAAFVFLMSLFVDFILSLAT